MRYNVLSNLKHNGEDYVAGATIELEEESAAPLIEAGVIETAETAASEGTAPADPLDVSPVASEPSAPVTVPTEPVQPPEPTVQPVPTQSVQSSATQPTPEEVAATLASVEQSPPQQQS